MARIAYVVATLKWNKLRAIAKDKRCTDLIAYAANTVLLHPCGRNESSAIYRKKLPQVPLK